MTVLSGFMASHHRQCDDTLARARNAAARGDWSAAGAAFDEFHAMLARHVVMEEEVLFPAFEDATGMSGAGPTAVMRGEHVRLRELMEQMKGAVAARDGPGYLELSGALHRLVQQHDRKEEAILYPMMDRVLETQASELVARCNALRKA